MKFCQHCGREILEQAVICPGCGCSVNGTSVTQANEVDQTISVGMVILSILIPLVGIIYWPVKAKTRPRSAKACGIAGIISWAVSFIFLMAMGGI